MTKKSKFFAELKKENNIKKFNVKEIKLNRIEDIRRFLDFESQISEANGIIDDVERLQDNFIALQSTIEDNLRYAEQELEDTRNELANLGVSDTPELRELQDTIDRLYDEFFELEDRAKFYNLFV
jgi:SepF-like predicted cell division protein (DUF552 family)